MPERQRAGDSQGAPLDHIVVGSPDLSSAVECFAEATGVRPAAGGRHPGAGTANYLVGLGAGAYLEIIGPDPEQPDPDGPRPFRVDRLTSPGVVTWAVRVTDIDERVAAARGHGYDPGPPREMSRRTATGRLLRWRLTYRADDAGDGLVPFLIDWGDSEHPAAAGLPSTPLLSVTASHRAPGAARRALAALEVNLPVRLGSDVGLTVVVAGEHGPVTLAPADTGGKPGQNRPGT